MAEKTEDGYKWKYNNGSKASLAYFLYKLFNPNSTGRIPFKKLNAIWGVTRLDSALNQVISGRQKWKDEINNFFNG